MNSTKKRFFATLVSILLLYIGCDKEGDKITQVFEYSFDVETHNWKAFFSDYPVNGEDLCELQFDHVGLPSPLDGKINSLMISSNNRSDDIFSCIYRKIDGLTVNYNYEVEFEIELASNTPVDAFGIGGDPNLYLGIGGINYPLHNHIDFIDHYRPNFESLLQSGESNSILKIIGNIGVSKEASPLFTLVSRANIGDPIFIKTNEKGELWVMIATDSGFEGTTTLYYKSIKIYFN